MKQVLEDSIPRRPFRQIMPSIKLLQGLLIKHVMVLFLEKEPELL